MDALDLFEVGMLRAEQFILDQGSARPEYRVLHRKHSGLKLFTSILCS
jgi:hypothetical protein